MNVLDSSLEAFVFSYASFGFFTFVNNLWTWIAVITAAVSFWKIRATTTASAVDEGGAYSVNSPPPCNDWSSDKPSTAPKSAEPPSLSVSASVLVSDRVEDDGLTKGGKFTLYYEDNGELTEELEEIDGDETMVFDGDLWESYYERMLKNRLGVTSWYRYQDLTELNGNVVRLWDGYCKSNSSSSRPGNDVLLLCSSKRCVSW